MAIRVLIVDDHKILMAGLHTLLQADPNLNVVGEATNGEEALRAAQEDCPDVILLDVTIPGTDTLEVTRRLVRIAPEARVLMLTMHEDSALTQEYLRAGASGYIIKRAADTELINAIYAVSRGIIYIHPTLMHALFTAPKQATEKVVREVEELTSREVEVLQLIVKGHTNRQIASLLNISVRTVETHRANLTDKLNLRTRVDLLRYASEHNLV